MFTPRRCSKRKVEGGLVIRTFTGTDEEVICEIGERTDLKHVVWVKNLRAYQTRVECSGLISEPSFISFALQASDTRRKWTAEYDLDDGEEHTFPRVSILSDHPNGGEQKIRVELEIDRHQRGTTESASLQIFVQS